MKLLVHSQTFCPTHYNGCNYLPMLRLKLAHVSKMGPWQTRTCIFYVQLTSWLCIQSGPKSGPSYRKQVVHPRPQMPQGEPVAKHGTLLLIIHWWYGKVERSDWMLRAKSWAAIWKKNEKGEVGSELRNSFSSHTIYRSFSVNDTRASIFDIWQERWSIVEKDAVWLMLDLGNYWFIGILLITVTWCYILN